MSLFATENGPTFSRESDSDSSYDSEYEHFLKEYEENQRIIDEAILRQSPEYLKERARLIHFVERVCFFDNLQSKKKLEKCVTLKNNKRGLFATMNLPKGAFTVEPQDIVWDPKSISSSYKDMIIKILDENRRILPCQISAYKKLIQLLPKKYNDASGTLDTLQLSEMEKEKAVVLNRVIDAFAWSVEDKEVVFSHWNRGCINFIHHSMEKANVIKEDFYTKEKGFVTILYCKRNIQKGEQLFLNYFSHNDSATRCKLLSRQKNIPIHPILCNEWTEIRNLCTRIYYDIQSKKSHMEHLNKLQEYYKKMPWIDTLFSGMLVDYIIKIVSPNNLSCDGFMKEIKHHKHLMKSFGTLRQNIIQKMYKRWAFERNLVGKINLFL